MAWLSGTTARMARCGAAMLLAVLMLCPCRAGAHSEEASQKHQAGDPFPKEEGPAVGIDERLGAKIPLDATFRDETGKTVRLGDLITGPTIILPVYYSCANVCNYLQGGLARVLPTIKNRPVAEYRVISFSFDESETPQLAARYKRMYLTSMNVPFPEDGWRFLTGDAANIRRVTAAAGYSFQRRGRDFIHPVTTLVVAGDGTIVRYLYGTTFLAKDVSLALLEAREGKAGASIRKVMEFCFSFDPTGKTYVFNLLRVSATVVILCAGGFLAFLLLGGTKRRKPGTLADKKEQD
ncbi:SCO family protein [Oryzomonas japonica]|nr:SCO family protein [Oryzomonas japonica]